MTYHVLLLSVSHLARHHPWFCDLADRSCRASATVAVDFDGVLHQKSGRFSDEVTGDPVPGAADGVRLLAERYHVVIFTARTALDPVCRWLAEQGMDGFEAKIRAGLVREAGSSWPSLRSPPQRSAEWVGRSV